MSQSYKKRAYKTTLKNFNGRTYLGSTKPIEGWVGETVLHFKTNFWVSVVGRNLILVY